MHSSGTKWKYTITNGTTISKLGVIEDSAHFDGEVIASR